MNELGSVSRHSTIARSGPKASGTVVMQVVPSLETGGVERGTVDVTAAIVQAGWRALVVSSGGQMVREIVRAGGNHIDLPVHSKNPLVMRDNVHRLADLIREHDVDIVHARSRAPAWSAQAAALSTGSRFVTTFHGTYSAGNFLKRRYNKVMASGERVIAISDFIANHLVSRYKADPGRVRVIHRGIDVDTFNAAAVSPERIIQLANEWRLVDGVPVIMLPGRLTRWKGQNVLIEAIARLGRRDLRCIVVGADQGRLRYHREIERRARRAGIGDIVQFVGHCRDMPAAYMHADVVVSASTLPEAFGRVAAEAQAMGRPVVATNLGAARETVLDGDTGWLVPPRDPAALAAALTRAIAMSAEERDRMAARAAAHVSAKFTRDSMCAQTLEVYGELLGDDVREVTASAA